MSEGILDFAGEGAGLSVLDVDLSFLATRAALELDKLIANKDTTLESVEKLSKIIRNSFVLNAPYGGQSSLYDPSIIFVMNKAFVESKYAGELQTVRQLVDKAIMIADELGQQVDPSKRNGELASLKRFCIALARCVSAFRESVFGYSQRHPYRK